MTEFVKSTFNADVLSELLSDQGGRKAFGLAVASAILGEEFGRRHDSYDVDKIAYLAAGITSSQYVARHMAKARRFQDHFELLRFAVDQIRVEGLFVEFGVFSGTTVNHIAGLVAPNRVYGFDSFEGLPEAWHPGYARGAFKRGELPTVCDNVELVVGWFHRTLPHFLDMHQTESLALIHVDCDLYSSTQTIFQQLSSKIVPGTIIVFDEYHNYPNWEAHEFRAFQEYVETAQIHYNYIGLVPAHQQVAVQIVG
jgi:predicted O-methyltransferase YrrM